MAPGKSLITHYIRLISVLSSYNGDDILAGLELATPLATGVYGGGEPLSVTLGEIPSEIGLLLGTIRMDITIKAASGDTWACIRIRARLV